MCRRQPPDYLIHKAENPGKFFQLTSSAPISRHTDGRTPAYKFMTEAEVEAVSVFFLRAEGVTLYSYFSVSFRPKQLLMAKLSLPCGLSCRENRRNQSWGRGILGTINWMI
jgi:hypothetical protein